MVPVVEETDVPPGMKTKKELAQCPRPLREFCVSDPRKHQNPVQRKRRVPTESKHPLMRHVLAPANHISSMTLTHLIIADIKSFHSFCFQRRQDIYHFLGTV